MIGNVRWALLVALSVGLAAVGCGDDDPEDGGGNNAPAKTVDLGGTFFDALTKAPVEGLEICTLQPLGRDPGCASTGADGKIIAEGFPTNFEVLFTARKDGIFPVLLSGTTTEKDSTQSVILTRTKTDVEAILTASGLTMEAGKGAVVLFAGDGSESGLTDASGAGLAGVSFTVSPAVTPVYIRGIALDSTATETDSSGWAVLLNVDPDTNYTVKFNHATRTCVMEVGWPGSTDNERRVPTKADMLSYLMAQCD